MGAKDPNTFLLQVNVAIDPEIWFTLKGEMPTAEEAHSNYCLVTSFQAVSCTIDDLLFEGGFEVVE